jgi:hypothetical protein
MIPLPSSFAKKHRMFQIARGKFFQAAFPVLRTGYSVVLVLENFYKKRIACHPVKRMFYFTAE